MASRSLDATHLADLRKSGLSDETIEKLGIYTARPGDISKLIGWNPVGVTSALVFPYPGEDKFYRVKVFPAYTNGTGHPVKYLQRKRSGLHLYIPPLAQKVLVDPSIPFAWTEGEKKAGRLCQEGKPGAALGGLWNWIEDNLPIDGLDDIAHAEREETIYPDSDVWARPDLLKAVYAFGRELEARGANVQVGIFPPLESGLKCGLDDFLQTHELTALESLVYISLKHKTFTGMASWWQRWRRSSLHTSRRKGSKAASPRRLDECPYRVQAGRLVSLVEKGMNGEIEVVQIADFAAHIAEESTGEDGAKTFTIEGKTIEGKAIRCELAADLFADERALKAALTQAAGAHAPIRAGMAKHLAPAIQLLSRKEELRATRRYERTGWAGERFLIPGRDLPGMKIILPSKLPYGLDPMAELALGLKAFESILRAMTPSRSTVAATIAFQAPLARLTGWRDERYALFLSGRTGTLKTSWSQALMGLYGSEFLKDSMLLKWGEGATTNALMAYAAHAHDLPLLIDNYKPNTGEGPKAFVNLIHNIIEGGEKERLTRAATLRPTKPVFCWPLITGEDVVDRDPASLARILIVQSSCEPNQPNEALRQAQAQAHHLSAVGLAWLRWLEEEEARDLADEVRDLFPGVRAEWAEHMRRKRPDMVNILRVASNLATNALTWRMLGYHPTLGPIAKRYEKDHAVGLVDVAATMSEATAESLEATRFLMVIRELLASGRYLLLKKGEEPTLDSERTRTIGWHDDEENNSVYLLPAMARQAVEFTIGREGLGSLSDKALYAQLSALGRILGHNAGRETQRLRVGGKSFRTLHLRLSEPEKTDA